MRTAVTVVAAAAAGAVVAWRLARSALARPPGWSLRTNVSGSKVPAVLGLPVAAAGLVATALAAAAGNLRTALAAALALVVMGAAGWWDDRRGDESSRGFAGHLRAGRLTGGVVKIAAGGVAGVAAGALVHPGRIGMAAGTALAVPLAANLLNLLDRAPGRTGKAALAGGIPLAAFGDATWAVAAAGALGGLAAVLPADLGERGMLGDAGANPLGALLGLGLAVSAPPAGLAAGVAVLLALNAASERWSFSQVIARTPVLRSLDAIGRK